MSLRHFCRGSKPKDYSSVTRHLKFTRVHTDVYKLFIVMGLPGKLRVTLIEMTFFNRNAKAIASGQWATSPNIQKIHNCSAFVFYFYTPTGLFLSASDCPSLFDWHSLYGTMIFISPSHSLGDDNVPYLSRAVGFTAVLAWTHRD